MIFNWTSSETLQSTFNIFLTIKENIVRVFFFFFLWNFVKVSSQTKYSASELWYFQSCFHFPVVDYLSAPVNTERMKNARDGNRGFHTVLWLVLFRISLSKDITSGDIFFHRNIPPISCTFRVVVVAFSRLRHVWRSCDVNFIWVWSPRSIRGPLNVRWKINKTLPNVCLIIVNSKFRSFLWSSIEWINGRRGEGLMDEWVDGMSRVDERIERLRKMTDALKDIRLMNGWMDGWMDGRMNGWMDGWLDA